MTGGRARSGRAASSSSRTSSSTTRCACSTATRAACRRSTTTSRARPPSSLAGVLAGAAGDRAAAGRRRGSCWSGPARRASASPGCCGWPGVETIALVDSKGLCHAGRDGPRSVEGDAGRRPRSTARRRTSSRRSARVRPTVLVGHDRGGRHVRPRRGGRDGRALGPGERPIVLPLSNPTSVVRGQPGRRAGLDRRACARRDRLAVRAGRAARRASDRDRPGQQRVHLPGRRAGGDRRRGPDRHRPDVPAAARETLAAAVTDERLAAGALYPPVAALREVSRAIAIAVAGEAGASDPEAAVDAAMWWPDYVPYLPARPDERRRSAET